MSTKEWHREYMKRWHRDNKEREKVYKMTYKQENKRKVLEQGRKDDRARRLRDPEKNRAIHVNYFYNLKVRVLSHYSVLDVPVCAHPNCLVMDIDMLCLDHINNNGKEHRKSLGARGGQIIYGWILKNNFPEGFQVLCHNHNFKKEIKRRRNKISGNVATCDITR